MCCFEHASAVKELLLYVLGTSYGICGAACAVALEQVAAHVLGSLKCLRHIDLVFGDVVQLREINGLPRTFILSRPFQSVLQLLAQSLKMAYLWLYTFSMFRNTSARVHATSSMTLNSAERTRLSMKKASFKCASETCSSLSSLRN